MPHRFQKPTGEALTGDQRAAISAVVGYINEGEYDIKRLVSGIKPFVKMMSSACATDDSRTTMVDELERWVRWNRVPAFWLTFVFQLAVDQPLSFHTITAKRLFADARFNLNDDLGLLSLEDAFIVADKLQANSPSQEVVESSLAVADYIRKIYLLFRNWYSTRPYSTIEPLSEHPYNLRVTLDLFRSFPELGPDDPVNPDAWMNVIAACAEDEEYLRVIGRRFAGWAFEKANHFENALNQYRLGVSEAVAAGLESEICHLGRYAAKLLRRTGRPEQAEALLREAMVMESHLELSYWQALTARELALALRDKAVVGGQVNDAAVAFTKGRQLLDEAVVSSHVPVARAVKEQISRSYADDAVDLARTTSPLALLSEIEAAGPRYATDVIVESELARQLPAADALRFRRDRAEFAQHRALFIRETDDDDSDFIAYMGEVKHQQGARDRYVSVRRRLGRELVVSQLSTEIARKIAGLEIPGLSLLLFHLADKRTYAVLVDCDTHGVAQETIEVGLDFWRQCTDTYHANLAAAMDSSMRRNELLQSAVDQMIATYESALAPLLKTMLPRMRGRHVKILPRLGLNEVPFHAIRFGGKYLIESADISYTPTLGAFLAVQADAQAKTANGNCSIIAIHDEKRTPAYAGTLRALSSLAPKEVEVVTPATCENLSAAVSSRQLFDLFFACHGRYDIDDPRNSVLEFDANERVSFADLFAELEVPRCRSVLMGACESGLGRTLVAAEYVGLPLAFLSSGAPYVIGALWQVNRLSAAILVNFYYEFLSDGKMTVVQALNAAQRNTMGLTQDDVVSWVRTRLPEQAANWEPQVRKLPQMPFAHPYFWGGFFVTGAA
jgi:CHAT domain-containing protein